MRKLSKNYSMLGPRMIIVSDIPAFDAQDIRLVVNETQGEVLVSSLNKAGVTVTLNMELPDASIAPAVIKLPSGVPAIANGDILTIEVEHEDYAKEQTLQNLIEALSGQSNGGLTDEQAEALTNIEQAIATHTGTYDAAFAQSISQQLATLVGRDIASINLTDAQATAIGQAIQSQMGIAPSSADNARAVWAAEPGVAKDATVAKAATMAAYMTALISYFGAATADRKAKHLTNLDEHAATRSLITDKHADLAANLGDPVMEGGKSLRELVGWEQGGGKSVAELVAETLQSVKLLSADPTPLSQTGINLILYALGIATDDTLAGYEFLSEQECRDMINEAWSTTFGKADPQVPGSKDFEYICELTNALLDGDIQQSAKDAVEELMERLRSPLPA